MDWSRELATVPLAKFEAIRSDVQRQRGSVNVEATISQPVGVVNILHDLPVRHWTIVDHLDRMNGGHLAKSSISKILDVVTQ